MIAPVERPIEPEHVQVLRVGHGANCSSLGSVIDTLFGTAVAGAALLAAVVAALKTEDVHVNRQSDARTARDGNRHPEDPPEQAP